MEKQVGLHLNVKLFNGIMMSIVLSASLNRNY